MNPIYWNRMFRKNDTPLFVVKWLVESFIFKQKRPIEDLVWGLKVFLPQEYIKKSFGVAEITPAFLESLLKTDEAFEKVDAMWRATGRSAIVGTIKLSDGSLCTIAHKQIELVCRELDNQNS